MPDYARACRPPDYAPNYAIMPSIMARALVCVGQPGAEELLSEAIRLSRHRLGSATAAR